MNRTNAESIRVLLSSFSLCSSLVRLSLHSEAASGGGGPGSYDRRLAQLPPRTPRALLSARPTPRPLGCRQCRVARPCL
jgi:hypothetical protein